MSVCRWRLNARHAMLVARKRAARAERAASGIDVEHEYVKLLQFDLIGEWISFL